MVKDGCRATLCKRWPTAPAFGGCRVDRGPPNSRLHLIEKWPGVAGHMRQILCQLFCHRRIYADSHRHRHQVRCCVCSFRHVGPSAGVVRLRPSHQRLVRSLALLQRLWRIGQGARSSGLSGSRAGACTRSRNTRIWYSDLIFGLSRVRRSRPCSAHRSNRCPGSRRSAVGGRRSAVGTVDQMTPTTATSGDLEGSRPLN